MAPRRASLPAFETALRALAYGGGAVLLGLMAMVVSEVAMRYLFGQPFLGGFEMTELAMVLIVALGLPYCAITGGHVAVDVFAPILDRRGLRWISVVIHLVGAALLAGVAWHTVLHALGSYRWGDATNMMAIPKYPFQLVTAGGAALFALVLLLQAWKAAFAPPAGDPTP